MGCCGSKSQTAGDGDAGRTHMATANNKNTATRPAETTASAGAKQPAQPVQPKADPEEQARLAARDRLQEQRRKQEMETLKAKGGFISYNDEGNASAAAADRPAVEVQITKAAPAAQSVAALAPPVAVLQQAENPLPTSGESAAANKAPAREPAGVFSDYSEAGSENSAPASKAPTAAARSFPPPPPSPPVAAPELKKTDNPNSDEDSDDQAEAVEEEKPISPAAEETRAPENAKQQVVDVTPEKAINVAGGADDDLRGPSTARIEEVPLHLAKPAGHDGAYGHDLDHESDGERPVSPLEDEKAFRRPAPPPPPPPPLQEKSDYVDVAEAGAMEELKESSSSRVDDGDEPAPHHPAEDGLVEEVHDGAVAAAAGGLSEPRVEEDVVVHPDGSSSAIHKTTAIVPAVDGYTVQHEQMEIVDKDAQGRPIGTRHVENTVITGDSGFANADGDEAPYLHPLKVEEDNGSPLTNILRKEMNGRHGKGGEPMASPLVEEPTGDSNANAAGDDDSRDSGNEEDENGAEADVEDIQMNVELTQTSEVEEQVADENANAEGEISLTSTNDPVEDGHEGGARVPLPAAANKYLDEDDDDSPQPIQVQRAVSHERSQSGDTEDAYVPMPKVLHSEAAATTGVSDVLDDLFGSAKPAHPSAVGGGIPAPLPSPAANHEEENHLDGLLGDVPPPGQDSSRVLNAEFNAAVGAEGLETPPPRRAPPAPILSPPPPAAAAAVTDEDSDDGSLKT